MSELEALAVAEQVILSPVVFSMRAHYRPEWLVKSSIELATECVEYANETDEDPWDLAAFVVAKFGQAAIKRDTLKADYMLQEAYRELVEDRASGLLKEYDAAWDAATESLEIELSDLDGEILSDEHDQEGEDEKIDEPVKDEKKSDEPIKDAEQVEPSQSAEQGQPSEQVEAKKDEPSVEQLNVPEIDQSKSSEAQQVSSDQTKADAASQSSESPLKSIAVADLKIDSKFRKALIAAGLNTAEDVVKFHQEKGLASLPVLGEKSAATVLGVIEGLKG